MGEAVTSSEDARALGRSAGPAQYTSSNTNEKDLESAYTLQDQSSDDVPVEYHYLTFETKLPAVPLVDRDGDRSALPPYPNLRPYDDPFTWSPARKNFMVWLSCAVTVTCAYSAGSYESAVDQLTLKWGISNVAFNTGFTIFTLGFGIAPMALAPFSEEYGRRPVFLVSGLLYVVCQLCCALTESFGGMLASRLFLGIGGSTFSTMVAGILADIYVASERNTPMVIFVGATLAGTGLGPLVSGFVGQNLLWRWIWYIQTITCGTLMAAVTLFFKETRGSVLLSRKAQTLNKWCEELEAAGYIGFQVQQTDGGDKMPKRQRIRWKVKSDEQRATLAVMIKTSLSRPFHLLFTESVVFWFSAWVSFSWEGVLYLTFGAVPLVFRTNHNFNLQETGAVFAAMIVGAFMSTVLSIFQEKFALRFFPDKVAATPEGRLYFACFESFLMPIGLFMFGWTSYSSIHWIVPSIAIAITTMGIFSIYLATFNYLADIYHKYASSALAAQSLCRNVIGGILPLVTVQMYTGMGYPAASSLLGALGVGLSIVPWVLIFFGPRIRARSPFASEIVD